MLYFEIGIIFLALFGAFLNARGDRNGFVYWMFTNTYLMVKNIYIGEYAIAVLFLAYLGLAVYGYVKQGKNSPA
jgi:hypothetical protein